MYAAHFSLREPPFSIAPDPAFLYMSARHQEALGHLLYGTGQYGGFVQLTGEVGTGKTTIVRTLLAQKLDNVDVAMIHNPRQNELEFVQSICDEVGVVYAQPPTSIKALVDALNAHLLKVHAAGRRTVLIIDEAQNLPVGVLEQVRLLTNLETDKEKLLRIMLIGQPELIELLARPDLRQLASRITARYHLMPLTLPETTQYIVHRLQVAGGAADLFTEAACRRVHHYSKGVPRQINILCDRALLGTYSKGYRTVTPAIVDQAAAESLGIAPGPAGRLARWRKALAARGARMPGRTTLRWIEGALAVAALLIAGALLRETLLKPRSEPAQAAVGASTATVSSSPTASPTLPSREPAAAAEARLASPASPSAESAPAATLPEAGVGALRAAAQPLPVIMSRLVGLWRPQLKLARGENVCRQLSREGLECYRSTGRWADLRQMDRPAILTLSLDSGETQYVLLRHLDGDMALLESNGLPLRMPLDQLDPLWRGEFLLLWLRETDETTIGPQTRGYPVMWLRQRLAAAAKRPPEVPISERWDPGLREAVRRFQTAHGLDADGLAGIRTLIALSSVTLAPGTPVLTRDAPR